MVRKILAVTVGLAALTALSACEHFEHMKWKGENPTVTDAQTGAPEHQPGYVSPAPQQAAGGHNFPPPNERDLFVMTDKLSGGSVEIYDVNSGTSYGSRAPAAAAGPMPSSVDPSVEIYPIGGGYAGQLDHSWPNSVLPSNEMSIGARPSLMAGGGRASPHVGSGYAPTQVFFKHGSSRLGSGDKQVLRTAAEQAKFSPVERVKVEGYASSRTGVSDPVESKIVNLKESMNRAFTVSSELMREGVPAEKIQTTVWGDTNNSGDNEAYNRRVDVITGGQ